MIVVFDTETTGINDAKILEIAWLTVSDDLSEVFTEHRYLIAVSEDTVVQDGAFQAHGLTVDHCREHGAPIEDVLGRFGADVAAADKVMGHNVAFDIRQINAECERIGLPFSWPTQPDGRLASICTMLWAHAVWFKYGKWPKLAAAYERATNTPLENAHSALADVRASLEVARALRALQAVKR